MWDIDIQSPHLHFSYYESSFFLCALFPKSAEGNQLPFGTHSLNEWIPWSWETIQGGYNNIFFFFGCFVIESNTSFGVFKDDTWGMRWSLIESTMILLALALASSPSGSYNFLTDILIQLVFFKDQGDPILPCLKIVSSP